MITYLVTFFAKDLLEKSFDSIQEAFQYGVMNDSVFSIWQVIDGHYYKMIVKCDKEGLL